MRLKFAIAAIALCIVLARTGLTAAAAGGAPHEGLPSTAAATQEGLVVAEVDGVPVSLAEFRGEALSNEWRHKKRGQPAAIWRMQVLDRVIENRAVLKAAERDGTKREPRAVLMLRLLDDHEYSRAYVEREVAARSGVREEEVRAFASPGGEEMDFQLLVYPDPARAAKARLRLIAGEQVERLIDEGAAARRGAGKTGPVMKGSGLFTPETEASLFALQTGEVSEPFTGLDGRTFIALATERRLVPRGFVPPGTRESLAQDKATKARQELKNLFFSEDKVSLNYEGIQRAVNAGCRDIAAACATETYATDRTGSHPFSELLAYWDLVNALKRAAQVSGGTPWIEIAEQAMSEKAAAGRGRAAGIDRDPAVRRGVAEAEKRVVYWYLQNKLVRGVRVEESEIAAIYKRDKELKPAQQKDIAERKEAIRQTLLLQRLRQAVDAYITRARAAVKVKIYEDRLSDLKL